MCFHSVMAAEAHLLSSVTYLLLQHCVDLPGVVKQQIRTCIALVTEVAAMKQSPAGCHSITQRITHC